ncbi:MAG: threonine/serine exporter family protein [Clostridia bacterium]|nr:threonine/serine exporter family protein [Clostridia bacterium]
MKIISGIVATFGFAMLFKLKPKHWAYASLDGAIACVFYFVFTGMFPDNAFIPNLVASFACAFGAEVFARICKAPSTVFLLPGCIVLVPGGSLYYSMSNLLNSNYREAAQYLLTTAEVGAAIGGGIIIASLLKYVVFRAVDRVKNK